MTGGARDAYPGREHGEVHGRENGRNETGRTDLTNGSDSGTTEARDLRALPGRHVGGGSRVDGTSERREG